eukprot:scaffold1206_cov388-Prasinococcus_capsulatus_cf.AAC.11
MTGRPTPNDVRCRSRGGIFPDARRRAWARPPQDGCRERQLPFPVQHHVEHDALPRDSCKGCRGRAPTSWVASAGGEHAAPRTPPSERGLGCRRPSWPRYKCPARCPDAEHMDDGRPWASRKARCGGACCSSTPSAPASGPKRTRPSRIPASIAGTQRATPESSAAALTSHRPLLRWHGTWSANPAALARGRPPMQAAPNEARARARARARLGARARSS